MIYVSKTEKWSKLQNWYEQSKQPVCQLTIKHIKTFLLTTGNTDLITNQLNNVKIIIFNRITQLIFVK